MAHYITFVMQKKLKIRKKNMQKKCSKNIHKKAGGYIFIVFYKSNILYAFLIVIQ